MDNMYEPPGGDPTPESRPTEQFWPMSQGPGANQRPGDQDYRDPGDGARRRHPLHWTAGLVAAGALAVGGIAAGVALAGHSSPAASTAGTAGTQAAALNSALNSAAAPGSLALTSSGGSTAATSGSTPGSSAAAAHPCITALKTARADRRAGNLAAARAARRSAGVRCLGWRHRLARVALLRGVDGQFTFRARNGDLRTLSFQRGVVQSVSGSDVVVHAADGTTWTWVLVSNTVVRESGQKTTTSALTTGEPVWVGGPVVSGAKDARLIVIRPPSGSSSSPSSPSSSSPSVAPSASSSSGS